MLSVCSCLWHSAFLCCLFSLSFSCLFSLTFSHLNFVSRLSTGVCRHRAHKSDAAGCELCLPIPIHGPSRDHGHPSTAPEKAGWKYPRKTATSSGLAGHKPSTNSHCTEAPIFLQAAPAQRGGLFEGQGAKTRRAFLGTKKGLIPDFARILRILAPRDRRVVSIDASIQ